MYSFKFPYILHTEWSTVIYFLHGGSQENQCMLVRAFSNSSIIFKCSVLTEFSSGLFFWISWIFFVFLESVSFFPFSSCTWLELDVYTVCYASLFLAQLQYNVCACVCVCVCVHRDTQVRDSWKKQKQSRFCFYANLNDCPSLDKVWHIPWCFIWTATITWLQCRFLTQLPEVCDMSPYSISTLSSAPLCRGLGRGSW